MKYVGARAFRPVCAHAIAPWVRLGGLQLPEAQLIGRMLLQRLATGAMKALKCKTLGGIQYTKGPCIFFLRVDIDFFHIHQY